MEAMDIQAVESKLSDVTVTAIPMSGKNVHKDLSHGGNSHATISTVPASSPSSTGKDKDNGMSKYAQLLAVIEEMGKELHYLTMNWDTKWRWHTGYSADSVEWCPVEPYRDVLVCGTYQLDKTDEDPSPKKQTRLGKIYVFRIDGDTTELSPMQTINTAGILDQKWCYHTILDYPILATATSNGTIELYRLVDENGTLNLNPWLEHSIGQDVLALSLDWSTNKLQSEEPRLAISDSSGSVTILRVVGECLEEMGTWKTHGFEAWIAAFNYWNPDVFYSGADDCMFKSYDVRVAGAAIATNRSHDAGVTSVRSHLDKEHELLTGSYDEKIRQWDTRNLKTCFAEIDVNGGVWRMKYHPVKAGLVLAACMYGGFRLLEKGLVVSEYREHESIAYGADWSHAGRWLATCSFYDCKLHVSEVSFESC